MQIKNLLFTLLLIPHILSAQNTAKIKMSDFMGINTNVAAYDNKFLSDLSKSVKWVREYHDWSQYEAANNYYKWDNITTQPQGYTWPDHTLFIKECKRLGINVLADILGKPSWLSSSPIPYSSGTGTNADDYMEKLEFIGQMVARYGSKKIDIALLETADKATGLDYIKYYEDDNEPDYTWKSPRWTAVNYAKYCNAVHDGFGVSTDTEHPLLGIKSVDPDAKHVMAGLASADTIFVNTVINSSGGRIPFDVLNVHWYCTDMTNAYSPENENYGYEKSFRNFFKWRNRVVPEIPIWMTEFGWDTYLASNNQHSYTYAPLQQQANYILRAYLVLLKLGFEKSFLFMDTDSNSKNILQYSTSGLLTDKSTKYARKLSWYYLTTMQNVIGNSEFSKVISFKESSATSETYCLEFKNQEKLEKTFVVWTRKTGSKTDDGTKTAYELNLGFHPDYAYSIQPTDLDMDGDTISLDVPADKINLMLSETPQFIVVSDNSTGSSLQLTPKMEMNVFPNPAENQVQIAISIPEMQKMNISAYSLDGKLIKTFVNGLISEGPHHFVFGENIKSGTYLLIANSANAKTIRKIILLN